MNGPIRGTRSIPCVKHPPSAAEGIIGYNHAQLYLRFDTITSMGWLPMTRRIGDMTELMTVPLVSLVVTGGIHLVPVTKRNTLSITSKKKKCISQNNEIGERFILTFSPPFFAKWWNGYSPTVPLLFPLCHVRLSSNHSFIPPPFSAWCLLSFRPIDIHCLYALFHC